MNDKLKQFYKDKYQGNQTVLSEQSKAKIKDKIFANLGTQTTEVTPTSLLSKISSVFLKTYVLVPLVVLLFLSSTAIVSANALPGDILYPVKLQVENAQILLAPTSDAKLDLQVNFAQKRINEAEEIKKLNHTDKDSIENNNSNRNNTNSQPQETREINISNKNEGRHSEQNEKSKEENKKVEVTTKPINKSARQVQAEQQAVKAIEFLDSVREKLKEKGKENKLKDIEEKIKEFESDRKYENKSGSSNKGKGSEDKKDEQKIESKNSEIELDKIIAH